MESQILRRNCKCQEAAKKIFNFCQITRLLRKLSSSCLGNRIVKGYENWPFLEKSLFLHIHQILQHICTLNVLDFTYLEDLLQAANRLYFLSVEKLSGNFGI